MSIQPIRVRAGALILRAGQVLLCEYDDDLRGLHYAFPGGGVEMGETLYATIHREVYEETCAEVEIQRLLLVYEYIPREDGNFGLQQQVSLLFLATLLPGYEPHLPEVPEGYQTGVCWIDLNKLHQIPLLPPGIYAKVLPALEKPDDFDPFMQHD